MAQRLIMTLLAIGMSLATLAIAGQNGPTTPPAPIHIEADSMESDKAQERVFFHGHVEAKQNELVIRANEMIVYYSPGETEAGKPADGQQSIRKIEATGSVAINKPGWVATGDRLDYSATEKKIVLTGNTKVWQDNNMVSGETIVLYLDSGKSVIERGSGKGERVKAVIYPE